MGEEDVLVVVGEIGKAHGLQGEMKITPLTDWPDRFIHFGSLFVMNSEGSGQGAWFEIERARIHNKNVFLKLAGISTRDDAESLRGYLLKVKEEACSQLPEDVYHFHNLQGLRVRTVDGREIGFIKDVLRMPAQDIFVIDKEGQEILVPAVKNFVKKVDLSNKLILIQPIEGLLGDDAD